VRIAAPLHAIFVHFSVALTVGSLAFDAAAAAVDAATLREAAWWSLAASTLMTGPTLLSGLVSRLRLPMEEGEARSFLRTHMALGPLFFGCLLALTAWRGALWESGRAPEGLYWVAGAAVLALLTVQGFLGGELVYRYGAEVHGSYRRLPGAGRARTS
jgi:uncharacterized membrane protein